MHLDGASCGLALHLDLFAEGTDGRRCFGGERTMRRVRGDCEDEDATEDSDEELRRVRAFLYAPRWVNGGRREAKSESEGT